MAIPSSGQLREYADIGVELGVAQSNVSLRGMSAIAGFSTPDAMSEFYGYSPSCFDVTTLTYSGINVTNIKSTLGNAGDFSRGLLFSPDGTKLFVKTYFSSGNFNDVLWGLNLSTPYNISTWSYSNNTKNFGVGVGNGFNVAFNNTGTKIFNIQGNTITEYNLSSAFNLTTTSAAISTLTPSSSLAGYSTEFYEVQFNDNGTKLFFSGSQNIIIEYSLSTPYSLSSASFTRESIALNTPVPNAIIHIRFTPDGSKILFKRTDAQIVVRNLSTPFDVSTISGIVASNSSSPLGDSYDSIAYNSEGTIVVGFNGDTLYSLTMCS